MLKQIVVIIVLIVGLVWFYRHDNYYTMNGTVFDTNYQIITDKKYDIEDELQQEFADINMRMSVFVDNSEINKINQAKRNVPITVSDELFFVLEKSKKIYEITGGYFDVTVGALVDLWGFGIDANTKIPSENEINNVLRMVGFDKIVLNNNSIIKITDDVEINLSGIAKGYAVDRIAYLLEQNGCENYLINIGGEIKTRGQNNNKAWQIGISYPDNIKNESALIFSFGDAAMATSGDYQKFYVNDGKKYSHTINPMTGRAEVSDLVSVTVFEDSVVYADGIATAMMAMGQEKAFEFAAKNKIMAVFMINKNNVLEISFSNPNDEFWGNIK